MDACIAAAGVLKSHTDCLEYPAKEFQDVSSPHTLYYLALFDPEFMFSLFVLRQVMSVNVNGVLFTAQAAGRQMMRFGNGGSIILIASMSGSITNKVCTDCSPKACVSMPGIR